MTAVVFVGGRRLTKESPRTTYKNQPAWDNYKRKARFSRPKKTAWN